jgi:CRISPR/Cas system-associated endonuclease Cas1
MLNWKVHMALVNAKLEPYLGFLHSEQFGKPSLVCDFVEIYRYLIDDFIIGFCKDLSKKDFITKCEIMSRGKIGKRAMVSSKLNMKKRSFHIKRSILGQCCRRRGLVG